MDVSFLKSRKVQARIAAGTLALAVGGLLYGLLAPKWYRSAIAVVPAASQKSSGIASLLGGELGGLASGFGLSAAGSADVARIAAVLQSAAVSDAVIQKFDLRSRYGAKYQENAREVLWAHCDIRTLTKPGLVQLSCEDKDPKFAQEMLTFFADFGNQAFRRVSTGSASEEVRFLERRIAELRRDADEASGRIREFQEKYQIVDLENQAKAVVSSVATLNSQRIAKQMELDYAKGFSSADEAGMRQLESQLLVVNEQLRDLEGPHVGSRSNGARTVGVREYEKLYRDRKVAEATLLFGLDRLEGAKAAEARDVSTFVVLDPATLPTRKARPAIRETALAGAVLGLLLSLAMEWWKSRRDGVRDQKYAVPGTTDP
jgi:tyrosine-protein kinase Etk/Wzc